MSHSEVDVLSMIEKAFGDSVPPAEEDVVYDNSGSHDECEEVRSDYANLKWRDVPLAVVGTNASALHFMTDEARAYYFPAFVRKCLLDYRGSDVIPHELLTMLTPEGVSDNRFEAFIARLSPPQKAALRWFVEYLRDDHPFYAKEAERALATYWRHWA